MVRVLWVCLGSALGGGLRYLISLGMVRWLGPAFPYGTLAVNVAGSFLIALLMYVSLTSTLIGPAARLLLTTGVMGGLTTYSTFNYETLELMREGAFALALTNIGVTLIACLGAGVLGLASGRALVGS